MTVLSSKQRAHLETELVDRLATLDDRQLLLLAEQLDALDDAYDADLAPRTSDGVTRRQAIAGVLGAGVLGAGLGGAGGWAAGTSEVRRDAQQTIQTWRQLVGLYERLDDVGLDEVLTRAMNSLGGVVASLRDRVSDVNDGLVLAEDRLADLDQGLAVLDSGLAAVEGAVSRVAGLVARLQELLSEAGERTGSLGTRVAGFFRALLERLPFGLGDDMLAVVEQIEELMAALPDAIESINGNLIEPLRTRFFPREGDSVHVRIVEPILERTLEPARALLDDVETLLARWENDLVAPANRRMVELEDIRSEIDAFRREHQI